MHLTGTLVSADQNRAVVSMREAISRKIMEMIKIHEEERAAEEKKAEEKKNKKNMSTYIAKLNGK